MTVYELTVKHEYPLDEIGNLNALFKESDGDIKWAMVCAFIYGSIQGKREERAKRKAKMQ